MQARGMKSLSNTDLFVKASDGGLKLTYPDAELEQVVFLNNNFRHNTK